MESERAEGMTRLPRALAARFLSLWIALGFLALAPAAASAGDERVTLLEENDSLYFNSDKHYTQGVRFSYLAPALAPLAGGNAPFDFFNGIAPVFARGGAGTEISRRYAVFAGQSFFTPGDIRLDPPDPRDRPYAGWLYAGVSLLQESARHMLENLELQIGVVGPAAFAKQVQNDFHQFIGAAPAKGWHSQIKDEPGVALSYGRLWRFAIFGDGERGADVVPGLGATVGNVFTYGEAGGLLRIGTGLGADYGPVRIRPSLSGTDYFAGARAASGLNGYFFVGAQGRVVGRNIFLDGNSFRRSASIDAERLVADFQAGFSLFWSDAARLDFSVVRRTEEFEGQNRPDVIGTAALAFSW